jgi:hypothetical protein
MPDPSIGINYLAVVVSAVVYMALGALWYSPALFGKAWMKGIGKTEAQVRADAKPTNYILGLLMSILAAYGIARVMAWRGGGSVGDGIMIALVAGICFMFAPFVTNDQFEARPGGLTFTNVLYHLVGFVLMGIIIGLWR